MTDDPKSRPALYYRLRSGLPAVVWPSPEGDEAIIQIGRARPVITKSYSKLDSTVIEYLTLLIGMDRQITAEAYHAAMASGKWFDGENSWETE